MQMPDKCIQCRNNLEITYGLPRWLKEVKEPGGTYGGPLSTPQCKSCGAPAYLDSKGWHIKKKKLNPNQVFTIRFDPNAKL